MHYLHFYLQPSLLLPVRVQSSASWLLPIPSRWELQRLRQVPYSETPSRPLQYHIGSESWPNGPVAIEL